MDTAEVQRFPGTDELVGAVASVLLRRLVDAQRARGEASLVLTGGTVAREVHRAVARHPDRDAVDWSRVDLWWGDERFVASVDPDRNSGQVAEDLLGHLPLDPSRVHVMPASDDGYGSAEAAATAYEALLAAQGRPAGPWFDVLMLGVGPDGHCASLFPGRPEVRSESLVLAVRDAPKPPPVRLTLGLRALARARHVMFVAAGAEKADAVSRAVAGDDVDATPAAGPHGLETTRWYVDDAAAAQLP